MDDIINTSKIKFFLSFSILENLTEECLEMEQLL